MSIPGARVIAAAVLAAVVAGVAVAQAPQAKGPGAVNGVPGHTPAQEQQADSTPLGYPKEGPPTSIINWIQPGAGQTLPAYFTAPNADGKVGIVFAGGPVETKGHPFFTPGPNGRACVTCHQPADGMSISAATARERWIASKGRDPLFAPIDGANCPSLPQDDPKSHSLLLERGLFRIYLPFPPKNADGSTMKPEFTLEVVDDPTGCNTDPKYGIKGPDHMVSIYRRPRIVANERYTNTPYAQFFNIKTGEPLPKDPVTGARVSLNIMTDARVPNLETQAVEAAIAHLQFPGKLPADQVAKIAAFERTIYMAQAEDRHGSFAEPGGPPGLGPQAMQRETFGLGNIMSKPVFLSFDMWKPKPGGKLDDKAAFRASVARGADLFFLRPFWIRDVRGINDIGLGNPLKRSCATCHNASMTGADVAPGWLDLGTTNLATADPQPQLPTFKLTCRADVNPHPFSGRVVYTHDPGRALISGRCQDIGAINLQQMRGLAARAPYFSNGQSANLRDLVDYYDRRFKIGFTDVEKIDLVNFLSTL